MWPTFFIPFMVAVAPPTEPWSVNKLTFTRRTDYSTFGDGFNWIQFKPDGTKMFLGTNTSPPSIISVDLATPWDVTTGTLAETLVPTTFSPSYDFIAGSGVLSPDGSKLWLRDAASSFTYREVTLSTPWDLSTVAETTRTYTFNTRFEDLALRWRADGSGFSILKSQMNAYEYSVSTAWDISTATYTGRTLDYSTQVIDARSMEFASNGTRLWLLTQGNQSPRRIYEYELATPWDLSTASYNGKFVGINFQDRLMNDFAILPEADGEDRVWAVGQQWATQSPPRAFVYEYNVPGARDDAQYLYVGVGGTQDKVIQYALAEPWVTRTGVEIAELDVSAQETTVQAVDVSPDGTKLYVLGSGTDTIYQYTLSTPWRVDSGSYASRSFSVGGQDTSPRGLRFKPDGTRVFVAGGTNTTIYQYDLSTAWDVNTAAYNSVFKSVSAQGTTLTDLWLKADGLRLFTSRNGGTGAGDRIYSYTLSTAWDISSATYDSLSFQTQGGLGGLADPTTVALSTDGLYAFVGNVASDYVVGFTLSAAWDITTAAKDTLEDRSSGVGSGTTNFERDVNGICFSPEF